MGPVKKKERAWKHFSTTPKVGRSQDPSDLLQGSLGCEEKQSKAVWFGIDVPYG